MLNQIRASSGIPPRVTLSETRYKQLELSEVQELLEETLVEEENTDELLSELAEDAINPAAASAA